MNGGRLKAGRRPLWSEMQVHLLPAGPTKGSRLSAGIWFRMFQWKRWLPTTFRAGSTNHRVGQASCEATAGKASWPTLRLAVTRQVGAWPSCFRVARDTLVNLSELSESDMPSIRPSGSGRWPGMHTGQMASVLPSRTAEENSMTLRQALCQGINGKMHFSRMTRHIDVCQQRSS